MGLFFSGTEGLVRVEEKLNKPKYLDSLNENPVLEHSELQTIQKVLLPTEL